MQLNKNENTNSILYRTQREETILKLYFIIPYQAMINILCVLVILMMPRKRMDNFFI